MCRADKLSAPPYNLQERNSKGKRPEYAVETRLDCKGNGPFGAKHWGDPSRRRVFAPIASAP
eukprot:4064895-Prymnesium_polylepis.1